MFVAFNFDFFYKLFNLATFFFCFCFFFCIVIIISLFFVVIALRETTSIYSIYTDVTYKIRLMPEYLVSRNENRILYSNCRV